MNEILKNFRKHIGLTQKDFADKLGVSRATIAQIEVGNNNLSTDLLYKIKKVFHVNLEELELRDGYLNNKISNTLYNPNNENNEVLKNQDTEIADNYLNVNKYAFKLADLGMLLDDNMKMLYFISSILKKYNYKFTNKEKRELKFYEGLDGLLMNIRTGKEKITHDEFEHLSRIIKSSLFSFINGMMFRAEELLEMNTSFDFDEILKPN